MKIFLYVLGSCIIFFFLISLGRSRVSITPTVSQSNVNSSSPVVVNKTYPIPLPDKMSFCDENVPLNEQDVRERLDRELLINTYWQSQTLLVLKEYNKIKPLIEPVLKKYNMPEDVIYMAAAESGFRNLVSPSNAVGVWQLITETAKNYGLEVNNDIDERYNYEKATEAACSFLKEAHDKFGSWTMAACAYNMGMSNMESAITNENTTSYYELSINPESSRYVFRILALKEIINDPAKYGFIINETDLYQPYKYKTITIDTTIHSLSGFATANGISYKELKILNPWLRTYQLPDKLKKEYEIKIMRK